MSEITKSVFKLFAKLLIASVPALMLLALYVKDDPFRVLYPYVNFYNSSIPTDRDYISTEVLMKKYPLEKYDSYILGSSKSLSFLCSQWDKYTGGKSFHFDASGESVFGILTKLSYLQREKMPVKNCLLIVDSATVAETTNSSGHTYIKHPLVSGESRIKFQFTFLTAFLSNKFFVPYFFYKFNSKPPEFLEYPRITDPREFTVDGSSNDMYFSFAERQMSKDINSYYEEHKRTFFERDSTNKYVSKPAVGEPQLKELSEIKKIFDSEKTNYKFVIYPGYDLKYLNPADVEKLKGIFGAENVFDYSGINEITLDVKNYYDEAHCRALVGSRILKEIYSK
jgi:hypothetical protein